MKAMTKIALVTASLISVGALTACQSTTAPQDNSGSKMMQHDGGWHHKTPEQREQMKQMRAQHKAMREQVEKACNGKAVGEAVQINAANKTINGSCAMVFKADRSAMREMKHEMRHDQHGMMYGHRGEERMKNMTEAQRAQIQQQRQQKRAQYRAEWEAVQQACAGRPQGQAIQVKLGEKLIKGTCIVKFKMQTPMQNGTMPMMNMANAS